MRCAPIAALLHLGAAAGALLQVAQFCRQFEVLWRKYYKR
jgi:hypothetical protein